MRYCFYGFSLSVLAYGLVLSRLTGGDDFLNSYPFVRADGYDWFYQGAALRERLLGHCVPVLWLLRDPGFVLVCALDEALRAKGLVVILAHTLAFFVTGLVLLRAARFYGCPWPLVASLTLILLVQPLNYVRLYVLADPLAVAFLTVSTYAMLHHLRTGSIAQLIVSGGLALVGGMTQTYAAIPFMLGAALSGSRHARSRRGFLRVSVTFVAFAACMLALKLAWRTAIPHEDQPMTFGYLEASFEMARFYATVWSLVYLPLLPLAGCALLSWLRRGRRFGDEVLFLAATASTFALLSFFYQTAEARFTFIYQPIVLLLGMALSSEDAVGSRAMDRRWQLSTVGAACSAVLVAASVAVTPMTYYGAPTLAWRPRSSWVLEAWFAQPRDRFELGRSPSATMYSHATMPPFDPYPGKIVSSYLALRSRQQDRLSRGESHIEPLSAQPGCQDDANASDNDRISR